MKNMDNLLVYCLEKKTTASCLRGITIAGHALGVTLDSVYFTLLHSRSLELPCKVFESIQRLNLYPGQLFHLSFERIQLFLYVGFRKTSSFALSMLGVIFRFLSLRVILTFQLGLLVVIQS
jgi:hypothetical protein